VCGNVLTCKIASLCISPVQAGIIFFSTVNSSFIFDLRRRSIKLWAVFLAIFRPAILVADGCFFFACGAPAVPLATLDFEAPPLILKLSSGWPRGFICIIFRDLVGGGGSVKVSFEIGSAAEDRLRPTGVTTGDLGDVGW
jgi:hypothetical protein